MKDFILYLLKLIVDKPENVEILETEAGDGNMIYTIKTDDTDTGKVIGKQGKIIQAVRNVAKVLAIKKGMKVRIEIA